MLLSSEGAPYVECDNVRLTPQDPSKKTLHGFLASHGKNITWVKTLKGYHVARIVDNKVFYDDKVWTKP